MTLPDLLKELDELVIKLESDAIAEHAEVQATAEVSTAHLDQVARAYGRGVAFRLAADRVRAVIRRAER